MPKLLRAVVLTNSSEDTCARVKVRCPGVWDTSPLMESVGGIPLHTDDHVYVDVSDGYENPIIIGRSYDSSASHSTTVEGSILFDSSDGNTWTVGYVKNGKLTIVNSSNTSIIIDNGNISINGGANGGLVNVDAIRNLVQALLKDLLMVGSGSNLSSWMGQEYYTTLEDTKVEH